MKSVAGTPETPKRRPRHPVACVILSGAAVCVLLARHALGLAQVRDEAQQDGQAVATEPAVAPTVLKTRDQALRKRAEEFYQFLQFGRVDEAAAYVASDSRDNFRREPKLSFLGFKIDSIKLQPDGREALVVALVNAVMGKTSVPIRMPQESRWVWADEAWYLVVPSRAKDGDLKGLFSGTGAKSQAHPEELKFKVHQYLLGRIEPEQVTVARFPFSNVTDHTVTLSSVNTFCDCLRVKPGKREFKPGESGELDIEFDPKGFELSYAQTIVVRTDPGNLPAYLSVTGYVVPPPTVNPKPKTDGSSAP